MVKIRKMQQKTRKMRGGSGGPRKSLPSKGGPRRIEQFSKEALDDLKRRLKDLNDGKSEEDELMQSYIRLTGPNHANVIELIKMKEKKRKKIQDKIDNINKIKLDLRLREYQREDEQKGDRRLADLREAHMRTLEAQEAAQTAASENDWQIVDKDNESAGPVRTVGSKVAATATKAKKAATKAIGSLFRRNKRGGIKSRKRKRTRHKRRKSRKRVTRRRRR